MDPVRRGHRHICDRHALRVGRRRYGGHDGACSVEPRLRRHHVHDVVDNDGRDDAAERGADPAALRADQSQGESHRQTFHSDRDFCRRLSGRLGRVQRARDRVAMDVGAVRPAVADDGDNELLARRHDPARRRAVAADSYQGHVLAPLPLADGVSCLELAARPRRRVPDGAGTRQLLPRLLLVPDGPAVFWRHHEPVLDYRIGRVRPVGEDHADGLMDRTDRRRRRHRVGCAVARDHDAHCRRPQ